MFTLIRNILRWRKWIERWEALIKLENDILKTNLTLLSRRESGIKKLLAEKSRANCPSKYYLVMEKI